MRYLGLDLGTKSLGLALSDRTGIIASFYKNISYSNEDDLILQIKDIVDKDFHQIKKSLIHVMSLAGVIDKQALNNLLQGGTNEN